MKNDIQFPLVSIVVVTYNSSKYVLETLQSIKDQSYENIQLIISDDCSTDHTVSICMEWLNEHKDRFAETKFISTPKNMGISSNCNMGLSVCKGEWVKFIAGDDALESYLIEAYIHFAAQNNGVELMCSNVREYRYFLTHENAYPLADTAKFKFNQPGITAQEQFRILLRCNPIWAPTVLFKRALIEKMGGFAEQYSFYEDRPMWLKLTRAGHKFYYLDIVSIKYRRHEESIQNKKDKKTYIPGFEIMRDKMLFEEYSAYLSLIEKICFWMITFRHRLILKVFRNKKNVITKGITFFMYYLPNKALERFKIKYNS